MQRISLINKQSSILVISALAISLLFLYFNRSNFFCEGLFKPHGEIAYNFYQYNSLKVNPSRMGALGEQEAKLNRRVHYYEIEPEKFGPPTEDRSYFDSPWYGVLIGSIWKVTNTISFLDIQIFQILLFCLLMLLLYQIAYLLFEDKKTAFICGIAQLFFLPVFYLNVQCLRDIYPYYAAVVLLYLVLAYLKQGLSWLWFIPGGIFVAFCQLVRFNMFPMIITSSLALLLYGFMYGNMKKILLVIGILFSTNFIFFWIPTILFNQKAYQQNFVSPVGINMIEGLGEFNNPWGFELSDGWYASFVETTFGPQADALKLQGNDRWIFFDQQVQKLVSQQIKENPGFYILNVAKRVPRLIFPGLPCFEYQDDQHLYLMFTNGTPIKELVLLVFRSPTIFFDFFIRHILFGLFLLLAYIGMFLLLFKHNYVPLVLVYGGFIIASYSVVFAHSEHRYLIPYYGLFCIFVGYTIRSLFTKKNSRA